MSSASADDQLSGHGKDHALQHARASLLEVVASKAPDDAAEVVGGYGQASQAALAMNFPDGRCARPDDDPEIRAALCNTNARSKA